MYYYSCSCWAQGSTTFESGSKLAHSYGSWHASTSYPGQHYRKCSSCEGLDYEDHEGGTWYDGGDGNHYKDCEDCSKKKYISEGHKGGTYYSGNDGSHYKDCSECSKKKWTSEKCLYNKAYDGDVEGLSRDIYHRRICGTCDYWNGTAYAKHTWPTAADSDHTCVGCGRVHSKFPNHYYNITNNTELSAIAYTCSLQDCSHQIKLFFDDDVEGLILEKYAASDAEVEMETIPELENGDYYITWNTNNTIYGSDGKTAITNISLPDKWVDIYGWSQNTVKAHCEATAEYIEEQLKIIDDRLNGAYSNHYSDPIYWESEKSRLEAELAKIDSITEGTISIAEELYDDWVYTYQATCRDTILNGDKYHPTVKYESSNNRFKATYKHGNGGWMFLYSPLFPTPSYEYTELFVLGDSPPPPPPPEKIYGTVYVYYRTTSDDAPRGNWSTRDYIETVVLYDEGGKTVSGTKTIDASKSGSAWKNGYRVVGHNVQITSSNAGGPASYNGQKNGNSASYTLSFEYTKTTAHITFFVEEAKADIKYCYKAIENDLNKTPNGTFESEYKFGTLTAWTGGTMAQTANVSPDMNLIWSNAYRYVGYAVTKNDKGKTVSATYPTTLNSSTTAVINENFQDYNRAEIIVTFFVKPAELTVKYCYRTTDNNVPNNYGSYSYQSIYTNYTPNPVKAWTNKTKNQTVTVDPDDTLIWKTGYRYVGYDVARGEKGKTQPATYNSSKVKKSQPGTHTDDFDSSKTPSTGIDEAEIVITFFVEEAKTDIYYCYRATENTMNQVPHGGLFQDKYLLETRESWTGNKLEQTINVTADIEKIWTSGYRYVGYAITRADTSSVAPASWVTAVDPNTTAKVTEKYDVDKDASSGINRAGVMVTFFVEPAELTVKYCYRTITNQVPNNYGSYTYQNMYTDYTPNPVKAWTNGKLKQTVEINPDDTLIWKTGYRYVGFDVARGEKGKTQPAIYNTATVKNTKPGTHTDDFDTSKAHSQRIDEAEIVITFFVDEAQTDIYYCYRATENTINQVPHGGLFQDSYYLKTTNSWDDATLEQEITIPADIEKIWTSGYRYVGYAVTRGEPGSVAPAVWETSVNPNTVASITESFDADKNLGTGINKAKVIVTFFVKPAELTVKYCYRTTDNKIPNDNGTNYEYQEFYTDYLPNPVKAWTNGTLKQTVTQEPNMNLIYGTGYRYVGFAVTRAAKGKSVPALYQNGVNNSTPGTHTDDFDTSKPHSERIDEAEIMITFFVKNAEATVLYCYRTPDNKIPTNNKVVGTYQEFYSDFNGGASIKSWPNGENELRYEVKKAADLNKIDNTGYRYLGYKIARAENGTKQAAPYGADLDTRVEAVWNEIFDASLKTQHPDSSPSKEYPNCLEHPEVIITFFIEPVKFEYGHKWRDMTNKRPDEILEIKELTNLARDPFNQEPLLFPDYYNGEKCLIPVKTLNKFVWPGFVLKSYEIVEAQNENSMIATKAYDDETTTVFTNNSSGNRLTVTENAFSYYIPPETSGYAKDKIFWYIYTTPQIKIEHKYHAQNGGGSVLDNSGSSIEGYEQILHQWAKVESLVTDNIGVPYSISIGDNGPFIYTLPNLDLVKLSIYEVSLEGVESYKGGLYENSSYATQTSDKPVSYTGTFGDYYMDTYANIQDQLKSEGLFNTNTNWKIVFEYVSVEKVHIRFYDLKGNIIFTKNNDGRYVSEITSIIDKNSGYTHVISNLGEYIPVAYTIDNNAYNKNYSTATEIKTENNGYNPPSLFAPPKDGDRYIIIFYSTDDMLRVDYRDTEENPIKIPPDYQMSTIMVDLPDTGTFVNIPEIPGYKVKEYRLNKDYNGVSGDIPGPGIPISSVPTQISVPSTGKNQFMIVYYEKLEAPTKVIVECREGVPSGEILVPGEELIPAIEIPLVTGAQTPISVPDIDGYLPVYYLKNDDPTQNPPYDIVVVGDPITGDQKIIIVYTVGTTPGEPEIPDVPAIITPDDNKEHVELRANSTTENEYNVEVGIPTSEDLYVSGDVYSYKFKEVVSVPTGEKEIQVKVTQEYYKNLDGGESSEKGTESTGFFPVTLKYEYYNVDSAKLYDLQSLILENDAIKYYKNYGNPTTYEYMENKAVLDINKHIPSILFEKPDEIIEIREGNTYLGTLKNVGTDKYEIVLKEVAYVRPTDLNDKYNADNLSDVMGVLGEQTYINLQKLIIMMPGQTEANGVTILTGKSYKLNERIEQMTEGVNYIPYTPGRAPLYHFLEDKNLYVQENVPNNAFQSKISGVYNLIEEISNGAEVETPAAEEYPRTALPVNPLSIHTPIVNKAKLETSAEHKNTIQLKEQLKEQANAGGATIITLDEKFTIEIPNSGEHRTDVGYKTKDYNHNGLSEKDDANTLINSKSKALDNKLMTQAMYDGETEENSIGPAFAEYKLIKFPYDVYLVSGDKAGASEKPKDGSTLFVANTWYNLYEYLAPNITKYTFVTPVWVKDAHKYAGENGIQILVVAENADAETLNAAKTTPMNVSNADANTNRNNYILRKTIDTYVSGRVYDLQVRDTDDPGYMGKVNPALSGDALIDTNKELPVAQQGQVKAYNMGMKLGYRFYFDLKTKGTANEKVNIKPEIYYVSPEGVVNKNISLFYHSKGSLYNKLDTSDLSVKMTLAGTHGIVNNSAYTAETISAKQLNPSRVFTNVINIGKLDGGLSLNKNTEKLPFDNILESAKAYGFGNSKETFVETAKASASITNENNIKDATGHWYGEYYLPASTIVVPGTTVEKQAIINGSVKPYTNGYLVVVFTEITTTEEDPKEQADGTYLTYEAPEANSQWKKENIDATIKLPNTTGTTVTLTGEKGAPMAIYQVNLRANNDYETEGTH